MAETYADPPVRLQMVSPLPPAQSGVAQYSRDLLAAVDGAWTVGVLPDGGRVPAEWRSVKPIARLRDLDARQPIVVHLGNSAHHRCAFQVAASRSTVIVLHDVVLHHGRFGELLRRRGGRDYERLMAQLYGCAGRNAARDMLGGRTLADVLSMPLCEDLVRRARLTVVHSRYAELLVRCRVPDAAVMTVPMGVPLPALVDQRAAREALSLPADRFIVASITHVNPHKRLPVVMRAMRHVVRRIPDALLVVAGSVAPGIDLEGEAEAHQVRSHVDLRGYVTDTEARLLARAADVCVNLRHPSMGETSASLLRLLGAGRPVIVTDNESSAELPVDAVMAVPVGRFEADMIAESLVALHDDAALRVERGARARRFVEQRHTMRHTVAGYRQAIERAYGVRLPDIGELPIDEQPPSTRMSTAVGVDSDEAVVDVAGAVAALKLGSHAPALRAVASAMVELALDADGIARRRNLNGRRETNQPGTA